MKRAGSIFLLFLASAAVAAAGGRLEIEGTGTVDVGLLEPGEAPVAVFRLKNTGDAPLRFTHVVATCRCLLLEDSPASLAPGASGRLVARARPDQPDGPFSGSVLIETDSQETPFAHVTVKRSSHPARASWRRPPEILCSAATNGLQVFTLKAAPLDRKPARLTAFLRIPESGNGGEAPLPGIVLASGGTPGVSDRRLRYWNERGFAAVAVDAAGDWLSPDGPAVEAVVRAHSLLRAKPGVAPDKIGAEGIARGAYAVCLAAAADGRFAFAICIDGAFPGTGETAEGDLGSVRIPFLWVDEAAGALGPLFALSDRLKGPQTFCLRPREARIPGEAREEPAVFARHAVRDGAAGFPVFGPVLRRGRRLAAGYSANGRRVAKASLFVEDGEDAGGTESLRPPRWRACPAVLREHHVEATLPEGASAYFLNLSTEEGLIASSRRETCLQ